MVFLVKPVGKGMWAGDLIAGYWKACIMKELW